MKLKVGKLYRIREADPKAVWWYHFGQVKAGKSFTISSGTVLFYIGRDSRDPITSNDHQYMFLWKDKKIVGSSFLDENPFKFLEEIKNYE